MQIFAVIDYGGFGMEIGDATEGGDDPFNIFEVDIGAEYDGVWDPWELTEAVIAAEGDDVAVLGFGLPDFVGKTFVMVAVALASDGIAGAADVFYGKLTP